ncbi:hypothetical protein LCGC14_1456600 [marine sediment metagenome]|uniref:Uncharacterized protein n=1 Tax=marine sediment metagenome TaxID=412755 RepID=A0A0F9MI85_9ZZZZ
MFKFLKAFGVAALLALPWASPISAAGLEGGNFTSVGDVSTAVCTTAVGESIDLFGNGVYDMVVALQVEVGSPGSGAWNTVAGFTDIFPTASTQFRVRTASTAPNQCFRITVTTDTSGTLYFTTVTDRSTPTEWGGDEANLRTHYRYFDDFQHGTVPITTTHNGMTPSYLVDAGDDAEATVGVIIGNPEGVLQYDHGDADTVQDISTVGFGLLTNGALVSTGITVFETRVHMSQITATHQGIGLSDVIPTDAEISFPDVVGITVTEGPVTTMANAVAFMFDTDQTTDQWGVVALNGNTLQNNSDVYLLGAVPVATTYQIFRIEVDSSGDCLFYINGDLLGALDACVATTAVLIPYWASASTTTTVGSNFIDYVDFWALRPSG